MATARNYDRNRQRERIAKSMITPMGKVARPPTAAEIMRDKPKDRPHVTLPRVKWLERPDP